MQNRQFDASEAQRGFANRMGSENQYFNQQQAGDQFAAGQSRFSDQLAAQQSAQNFNQRMAGENQFFNQGQAGNQFAANQAQFADQFGAQQGQQGFQNQMTNQQLMSQNDQFRAQQQQQGFQNRMGNQQLLGQRDQFGSQQNQQFFQNQHDNQQMNSQNDRFMAQQYGNQFNQDVTRRGIGSQERLLERQLPQQELARIMQMSGVGNPQFQQQQQYGPMPVNYGGMVQDNFNNQVWHSQNNPWMGALQGGMQAAMGCFSDRRLKKNITKLGRFSKGINWYSFRYVDELSKAKKRVGFMADEVKKLVPEAVREVAGYLTVDYGKVFNAVS